MKKVLLFIGLKIAEIGGVIFIPYYVGKFACWLGFPQDGCPYWVVGLLVLLITICVVFLLGGFVAANLKLVDKIMAEELNIPIIFEDDEEIKEVGGMGSGEE